MEEEIASKRAEKAKLAAQLAELKGQSVRPSRGAGKAVRKLSSSSLRLRYSPPSPR